MKKRLLSLFMAILMITAFALPASAAETPTSAEVFETVSGFYYFTGEVHSVNDPLYKWSQNHYISYFDMTVNSDGSFVVNIAPGSGYDKPAQEIRGVFTYYTSDRCLVYNGDYGYVCMDDVSISPFNGTGRMNLSIPLDEENTLTVRDLMVRRIDFGPAANNEVGMDGTYEVREDSPELGINHVYEKKDGIVLTVDGSYFTLAFEDNGKEYELNGYFKSAEETSNGFYAEGFFYGYSGYPNFASFSYNTVYDRYYLCMGWDNGTDHFWWEAGYLDKVEEPSGPQDYNVNVMGYGTSNTGEYMVNIVGNIQGTFDEGVTVLSSADVQAQNLSINTFNLTNGASRVMGISTVEGITVTVTNGAVANVAVKGRAQTNPGNFDRYTVNCNAF